SPAGIATGSSPWAASQPAGGATITGKVFLQGRTATFPPQIGHGIDTVTLIPGDDCKSALVPPGNIQTQNAADGSFTLANVPDGNYGIRGLASGYLTACRLVGVSGGVLQGTLPNATLRAGDTNFPGDNSGSYGQVDVNDVSLIAAAFGETPP